MYNTELKDRFTKQYTTKKSVREACLSVFEAVEKYERQWGADLCTQDVQSLEEMLNDLLGMRTSSKHLRLSILRDYVRWCISEGVPGATNGMLHARSDGIEKMKRQTVRNPRHLQLYLDSICDPEEMETVDNTIRCFYWLAYSGMDENDILKVTSLDVDLRHMEIQFGGESFPIYREALPALQNCMELTQFQYVHPNYGADKVVYKDRAQGDELLRGLRGAPSLTGLRAALSRKHKQIEQRGGDTLGLRLSYSRVWISGIFYRAYENEMAGIDPDFMDTAERHMAGKEYHLESGRNTIDAKQRAIARDYRKDYDRWKLTFKE